MKTKKPSQVGELIYGAHPILEALKAKRRKLISIYTTKPLPRGWKRVERALPNRPVNTQYVTREKLTRMTGSPDHMGIAAWMSPFPFNKNMFDPKKSPQILLLDAIQDVRNLGAIIRSAYCTNYDGIILCKGHSAPLTAAALKASAGLAEHMAIYVAPSMKHAAQQAKRCGYNLYMAVLGKGQDVRKTEFKHPMCMVIGNEATGITPEIQKHGTRVTLPQRTHDTSYNASVAAAILMFLTSYGTKNA